MTIDPQPEHSDFVRRISRLVTLARAIRVLRASLEYPVGHPERVKLPPWVGEWERQHGPAPASAEQILQLLDTP